MITSLSAISPIDGRYSSKTRPLANIFSEYGLIYHRLLVEIRYLQALSNQTELAECPTFTAEDNQFLEQLLNNFDETQAEQVKNIEKTTNHDVKAVEYYLKEQFQQSKSLSKHAEFIHFGLTSEDVNNLAYALMLKKATKTVLNPKLEQLIDKLKKLALQYQAIAMLARTHGQAASPTTIGKEIANVIARLKRITEQLKQQVFLGKCNGAVGNYSALAFAYPDIDWQNFSKTFIEQTLGLTANLYTTQIEPHDWIAELCHTMERANTILIDFSRDLWSYISLGYFKQRVVAKEVGSSTMPHKVNPIDFENAEGNLGLANAMLHFFAQKLPISRFQRDLTDSTVLRNIGMGFAHSLLAFDGLLKGLNKLDVNEELIAAELSEQWALLAEPIQTVMRRYGLENPYEQLKTLTRGQVINQTLLHQFIDSSLLPSHEKERLKQLRPETYLGQATMLCQTV